MTLRLIPIAAAAALLGVPATNAAGPAAEADQSFDVLCLSDTQPVVMRFQLSSDGKPLGEAWLHFVGTLFDRLDADKNGTLDSKEVGRLRPMLLLLTSRANPAAAGTEARAPMSRDDLAGHLRKNGLGPLRLPTPPPPLNQPQQLEFVYNGSMPLQTETLDKALLELLDTDKDGKLSAAELKAAAATLDKLDADENELLTTSELLRQPAPSPFIATRVMTTANNQVRGIELLPLHRNDPDTKLARQLLARYGNKPVLPVATPVGTAPAPARPNNAASGVAPRPPVPKRRLTQDDLKMSPKSFAAIDQDGDGELDLEELARFGTSCRPEVEIAIRFGTRPARAHPVEVLSAGTSPVTATSIAKGTEAAVNVPGVRLDLVPGFDQTFQRDRKTYLARFQSLDRDANGYLDSSEVANDPNFRELFTLFDRDGDGKVFQKELTATLDELAPLMAAATRGAVTVDVEEAGSGLFSLIDANGDNQLSLRERQEMPRLLERFDTNRDGAISPGEVPRRFRARLTRGWSAAQEVTFTRLPYGQMAPRRATVGPTWFQKMDRNQDGDVSRREFLGTDEDFRRIDTDGDGLIDAREAEAASQPNAEQPSR